MQIIQMKTNERIVLSLRMTHPTMDLSTFCESIGLSLFRYWIAGQPRKTTDGKLLHGLYENSYCCCRLFVSSYEDMQPAIEKCLQLLEMHKGNVQLITDSGGEVNFFIGWFFEGMSGLEFDWKILRRISDLKISLELDANGAVLASMA